MYITTVKTSCVNTRSIQNSKARFSCIKSSIKGDIRDTIFTQFGNLPLLEDCISLFKRISYFTTVSSLQLSLLSFNNILTFNPHDYKFNIPIINIKLIHFFVLSTTSIHTFTDRKGSAPPYHVRQDSSALNIGTVGPQQGRKVRRRHHHQLPRFYEQSYCKVQ